MPDIPADRQPDKNPDNEICGRIGQVFSLHELIFFRTLINVLYLNRHALMAFFNPVSNLVQHTRYPGMKHNARFSTDSLSKNYPEPEEATASGVHWVVVRDDGVGVTTGPAPTILLDRHPASSGCAVVRSQYLGHLGSKPVYAAEITGAVQPPGGMKYSGVRELSGTIPDEELALAGLAVQIIGFDRATLFCGVCGEGMRQLRTERAKRCPACGHTEYPRLSPAIIVLVRNADSVLMVTIDTGAPGEAQPCRRFRRARRGPRARGPP